ncbi:hypothetical protein, partial [Mesorhizobium sp. M8A.F.Ca.ET.213.01.1.1]|uniref:hypothetical protein n=1 Tax=Mesorhizobium sp. M8A.F.Ca.ET.213.01.1.1 TaxID=2563970 RepID=UPI001AEE9CCE
RSRIHDQIGDPSGVLPQTRDAQPNVQPHWSSHASILLGTIGERKSLVVTVQEGIGAARQRGPFQAHEI